jgi:FSR family fosmidomycin resistance protein-like MFS transporter
VAVTVGILLLLIFSKYFYIAGITSYFTFYVMEKFSLSVKSAQLHLFLFQFAVAAGTLIGGPVGDRLGRKYVIWISILGAAPFTLLLPHAGLEGTTILTLCIGVVLSSAFSAILVYAQALPESSPDLAECRASEGREGVRKTPHANLSKRTKSEVHDMSVLA